MKKRILFLIDAQNDFCEESGTLATQEAIKAVDNIVSLIEKKEFDRVVLTFDSHDESIYASTQEGKKLQIKHCIEGTNGHLLNKRIDNALVEFLDTADKTTAELKNGAITDFGGRYTKTIFKHSFVSPEYLKCAVDSVVENFAEETVEDDLEFWVCGFCTDICVISNVLALKGLYPEATIRVFGDCCAGTTEDMHKYALKVMMSCMVDVVSKEFAVKGKSSIEIKKEEDNVSKVNYFLTFRENWDGYGGNAFSLETVQMAELLLRKLNTQPYVFPTANGTIQFEYNIDMDNFLELEIEGKNISLMIMENGKEVTECNQLDVDDAVEQINKYVYLQKEINGKKL